MSSPSSIGKTLSVLENVQTPAVMRYDPHDRSNIISKTVDIPNISQHSVHFADIYFSLLDMIC